MTAAAIIWAVLGLTYAAERIGVQWHNRRADVKPRHAFYFVALAVVFWPIMLAVTLWGR